MPTNDFDGAWIVQREPGMTRLSSHTRHAGLVEAWRDVAAPEIEAIHTSAFSPRLLIQVHRPRPQTDQRIFKDPALALWTVGDPAPKDYDELFLDEQSTKGFVHLDVETVGTGEPFVFNTGATYFYPGGSGGPSGGGGGGGDVIQEWGVVRGSLRQRLVIPVAARTGGYFGSQWRTDVLVRNGDADPLHVAARYVPNPGTAPAGWRDATVTIAGGAILTLTDVLGSLFSLESGSGAVIFTPELGRSLSATSRTYTTSARGSYGMGVGAVDLHAAIGANFDITFAAGLLGAGFRTNLVATDVSGGGAEGEDAPRLRRRLGRRRSVRGAVRRRAGAARRPRGLAGRAGERFRLAPLLAPRRPDHRGPRGHRQPHERSHVLSARPPTHSVRTIPAIVHADGAFGAKFRTDLFLFNPSAASATVTLAVKPWDTRQNESIVTLTLAAHESRVLRDVLFTLFGKDGVGRLRYTTTSSFDGLSSVRATSRTYTADGSGRNVRPPDPAPERVPVRRPRRIPGDPRPHRRRGVSHEPGARGALRAVRGRAGPHRPDRDPEREGSPHRQLRHDGASLGRRSAHRSLPQPRPRGGPRGGAPPRHAVRRPRGRVRHDDGQRHERSRLFRSVPRCEVTR